MAKKRRSIPPPPPAVTVERAARLCRLLQLVEGRGLTRAALLKRLRMDVRGFYRDLQLLREFDVSIDLIEGKYVLKGEAGSSIQRLPFPDPHLTLGEAAILAKGRTALHRKIKGQLEQILPH